MSTLDPLSIIIEHIWILLCLYLVYVPSTLHNHTCPKMGPKIWCDYFNKPIKNWKTYQAFHIFCICKGEGVEERSNEVMWVDILM